MIKIIAIDRRHLRYVVGYYDSLQNAEKAHDRVVNSDYWKNNSIHFVRTFFERDEFYEQA